MTKTPEQQAQEYADSRDWDFDDSHLSAIEAEKWYCVKDFLAGHAAGKQDERERVRKDLPHVRCLIDSDGETFLSMTDVMTLIFGQADTDTTETGG